ncbi:MAG TPA: aspartate aminotransferase family protein [Planctomycetota bacterium]|nr:aspartate aminotransferase family protein [Planctomycetota bacterium]
MFWSAARGANVLDADGNCYIDLTAGFAVATLGHADPAVVRAGTRQAAQLLHGLGDVHPTAVKVELLERLAALAPQSAGAQSPPIAWKTILASSGSEAVVTALKTACVATGRPGVLAFSGGYHGLTHGALLATARSFFRAPVQAQLAAVTQFVAWPDRFDFARARREETTPQAIRDVVLLEVAEVLENNPNGRAPIGAIIVEPVQGRGGDRVPPEGFLRGLRALATRHGAVLIFDEIYCGLGRTGRLFASEREGVIADLYCVGKALGGGFPISACVGRADVIDAWGPSRGEAKHTSTFLGHPVGCAMALASLQQLSSPKFLRQVRERGARFWAALRDRLQGISGVADVRGEGWIGAIELVQDARTLAPDTARAVRAMVACLKRGVIVLPCHDAGHCLSLTPPACLTDVQAEYAIDVLGTVLDETSKTSPQVKAHGGKT